MMSTVNSNPPSPPSTSTEYPKCPMKQKEQQQEKGKPCDVLSTLKPECRKFLAEMPLGKSAKCCFNLENDTVFLNHGAFGTAPRPVIGAQGTFINCMEMNPERFIRRQLPLYLRQSAEELSEFIDCETEDVVFVTNATTGVNAVLRSLDLQSGDEVLCLNLTYPAVLNTLRRICYYTQSVVDLKVVDVPLPLASYEQLVDLVANAITENTRLAVFDHISSPAGLLLPLHILIPMCQQKGIPVLVDGANAPGQIPQLSMKQLNPDYYVGNMYKWCFTTKSCAYLYVKQEHQATTCPVVTSLGFEQGFLNDFSQQGTRDETSFLTVPTALDFIRSIGLERLYAHNKGLLDWATDYLTNLWGTEPLLPPWQRAPFLSAVRLPINLPVCADGEPIKENEAKEAVAQIISNVLMDQFNIVAMVVVVQDRLYIRFSAQIYNERSDYEQLGAAIQQLRNYSETICDEFKRLNVCCS